MYFDEASLRMNKDELFTIKECLSIYCKDKSIHS